METQAITKINTLYTVHCFASVRVTLKHVDAIDQRDAMFKAIERFNWEQLQSTAEFTDDFVEFYVEPADEHEDDSSVWFDGAGKEVSCRL